MIAQIKNYFAQERAMRMARGYREGHRYAAGALLNGVAPATVVANLARHSQDIADDYFEAMVRGAEQAISQFKALTT